MFTDVFRLHKPSDGFNSGEVIEAVIFLGICAAFMGLGWHYHVLPGILFVDGVWGWLHLMGTWQAGILLWHSAATLVAEFNLFPSVRAPVFEWLFWAVLGWPLAFTAFLGHWGVFAGMLAWEFYMMLLFSPSGDAWYPSNL